MVEDWQNIKLVTQVFFGRFMCICLANKSTFKCATSPTPFPRDLALAATVRILYRLREPNGQCKTM